jgi:dTDP-4-dehydrorhamnose reductase
VTKILLTGKNGQVGWELRRTLMPLGEIVATDREEMDLTDPVAVRRLIREVKPHILVNPGAYTAVDRAESEPELAMKINAQAPGVMAEEAARLGALLVHYSTDYVFDGRKEQPYAEEDAPNPLNVYGRSKLAGEEAIRASGALHLILRTSWVYGLRGKNFLLTVLRLAREREELRIVADQFGAPTWSRLIAEATALMIARSTADGLFAPGERSGIYHLSCNGQASWHEFARTIRENAIAAGLLPENCARIEAIPSSDYPTPARRPAYSVLANDKLRSTFGLRLPDWREALTLSLAELLV